MSRPILITIRVPVETRKTEDGVVATCQLLDVSCSGDSTNEALNELSALLTSYFGSCFDLGRFDQLFHFNGYSALEEEFGLGEGRFLDIGLRLGVPKKVLAAQETPRVVPSSLLSTWMT